MQRGFTLLETLIVAAVIIVTMSVAVGMSQAAHPVGVRSAIDEFDAVIFYARELAQTSGNGATLIFSARKPAPGFVATLYSGRPNGVASMSAADMMPVSSTADITEAALGSVPFTVFFNSAGHVTGIKGAIDTSTALADEPPCPDADHQMLFTFTDGRIQETRTLACRQIIAGAPDIPTPWPTDSPLNVTPTPSASPTITPTTSPSVIPSASAKPTPTTAPTAIVTNTPTSCPSGIHLVHGVCFSEPVVVTPAPSSCDTTIGGAPYTCTKQINLGDFVDIWSVADCHQTCGGGEPPTWCSLLEPPNFAGAALMSYPDSNFFPSDTSTYYTDSPGFAGCYYQDGDFNDPNVIHYFHNGMAASTHQQSTNGALFDVFSWKANYGSETIYWTANVTDKRGSAPFGPVKMYVQDKVRMAWKPYTVSGTASVPGIGSMQYTNYQCFARSGCTMVLMAGNGPRHYAASSLSPCFAYGPEDASEGLCEVGRYRFNITTLTRS